MKAGHIPFYLPLILSANMFGQKPNIVLIVSDDQSFNSIGYSSGGQVYTPTLDMLSSNGMKFTNAHHPVTVCSPSRYSMLTGKFSGRCEGEEYLSLFPPGTQTRTENNCELKPGEEHLGSLLKENGYTTGFVGKSHIMEHDILLKGNWASYGLQSYGQTDDPYNPAVSARMKHNHGVYQQIVRSYGFDYADGIYMANVKELYNDALNIHNLEWTVDKARRFIEQEKDKPFFLYFSTTLHHGPVPWANNNGTYWSSFDADPKLTGEGFVDTVWDFMPGRQEIQEKYVSEGFPLRDAYALLLDEGVKAIYQKIVELNLDDNTLIIFIPDHGMWRHGKATLYDYGLKVPMFMYWKGKITAGQVYGGLVQTVDFLPTILDIAGITLPAGYHTDGISLKSIMETGKGEAHSSLFGELGYSRSVKTRDWKYIAIRYPEEVQDKIDNGESFVGWEGRVLEYPSLTNNTNLGYYAALNNPHYYELDQLYDLNADSAETINVAGQYPEILLQMRELLSGYLKTFKDRPFREFTLSESDPPSRAHTPVPKSGTSNVHTSLNLTWTSEYKTNSHDVYFGTTNPPPFAGNMDSGIFNPGVLQASTKYYWRIDEKNANGTTTGDTWSFTTEVMSAGQTMNPFPGFNATFVSKNTLLKWDKSANASYYKLFLGKGSLKYIEDLTSEEYKTSKLKSNTVYFWRVDAVNAQDLITVGSPWIFTTGYGNIAPEAVITASSVYDSSQFNPGNVADGLSQIGNIGEWRSDNETNPWLELKWDNSPVVDKINLFDLTGSASQVINGVIEFSDGSSIETGPLPLDGGKKTLKFYPRKISSLKFKITEAVGQTGLSEIEVYDTVLYVSTSRIDSELFGFFISPNPAPQKQIQLKGLSGNSDNLIYIYNIDGRLAKFFHAEGELTRLDLSFLASGMYFIRVNNKSYDQTKKLVI